MPQVSPTPQSLKSKMSAHISEYLQEGDLPVVENHALHFECLLLSLYFTFIVSFVFITPTWT